MSDQPAAITPEDHRQLAGLCEALRADAGASWAAVVSGAGHFLASSKGPPPVETTAMASLVAGGMAAMGAVAQLVGEPHFPFILLEGQNISVHLSVLEGGGIVVVTFDARVNVGLVRLRARQVGPAMSQVLAGMARAPQQGDFAPPQITDEDIDALFGV